MRVQTAIKRRHHSAGHVHGADHVLKPGMLGRRIDPLGGLQLMNLPKPLQSGMVEQRAFRGFALVDDRDKGDLAMNRGMAQAFALEISHGAHCRGKRIGGQCPRNLGRARQFTVASEATVIGKYRSLPIVFRPRALPR
jgi:hypothetical protein